ncbi:alpha/beta hydrolase [Cupriavidus sp. WS]|uniref:alpha/beta hydrolase n=1 Tax=Cupriavidus sp. WS TaxID=1312922 RepID=UPI000363C1A5|nr:alpha/beta hydrolase [Cupriavidus sp. WS]
MPNRPASGFARLPGAAWMMALLLAVLLAQAWLAAPARAQGAPEVIDLPTRPGVTQRFIYLAPAQPTAAVILYAGGHGGLRIAPGGSFGWGANNFLVRARQLFVDNGLAVAVVDAPSDRLAPPFLNGFRQTAEHAQDAQAVIAWMRSRAKVPVWLVGTSRGTQSVAAIAIRLADGGGPDGIVLTSTILREERGRAVPAMDFDKLKVPVLVVHHVQDGCKLCPFGEVQGLMDKLAKAPRAGLIRFDGGSNEGDPCEALAYHGFNGIEPQVVQATARWMAQK